MHLVIANKDAEARTGATALATIWTGWASKCCSTTARIARGEVQGCRAARAPWIVVVGRGWADGKVELRNRFTGETRELAAGAGLATDITSAMPARYS